jgi:hypothetical protein
MLITVAVAAASTRRQASERCPGKVCFRLTSKNGMRSSTRCNPAASKLASRRRRRIRVAPRSRDGPYPIAFFGVRRMTCMSPSQEHRDRTSGGDVAHGVVIGLAVAIVTFASPFISKESPLMMHRRPLRRGRRTTSRRRPAFEEVTRTPTVDIGSPSLSVYRILTGGRKSIIHLLMHRGDVAAGQRNQSWCRPHAENIATAQLRSAARREPRQDIRTTRRAATNLSLASSAVHQRPGLRAASGAPSASIHVAADACRFARPGASRTSSTAASASSFGSSTGCDDVPTARVGDRRGYTHQLPPGSHPFHPRCGAAPSTSPVRRRSMIARHPPPCHLWDLRRGLQLALTSACPSPSTIAHRARLP